MANNNNPHGLKPLGISLGGGVSYIQLFTTLAAYGTAIFAYDAVNRAAAGALEASATPGTTAYSGVALEWGAASTLKDHLVVTDPLAIFEAQDDGSSSGITAALIGQNANLVLTAGNATTKISKHQIAASTAAVTATLDVHLLEFLNVPDNAAGANARVEITFNKHRMATGVVGV